MNFHVGVDRACSGGRRFWTMATRTTSQAKRSSRHSESEPAASRASSGGKAPQQKKAPTKKAAPAKKATQKSAARKSTRSRAKGAERPAAKTATTEGQMLAEQNAALKAELAQAKARIVELEALNADVVNRIDWVIDSLQTVIEDKR